MYTKDAMMMIFKIAEMIHRIQYNVQHEADMQRNVFEEL